MISSSKGIISLWDLKTKRAHTNLDEHSEKGILGLDITKDSKLIRYSMFAPQLIINIQCNVKRTVFASVP